MKTLISDNKIIEGLKAHNSEITRTYFYGYCRMAYHVYDKYYNLTYKPGMEFYALAHEYYIALDSREWRQLTDREPNTTLKTWMINGFRFIILDKLKGINKELPLESLEYKADSLDLKFDVADNNFEKEVRDMIMAICKIYFSDDIKSSTILQMMLIDGYKGKEVAMQLGLTPSAITQRFQGIMKSVVIPYFKKNFDNIADMTSPSCLACCEDSFISKKSVLRISPNIIKSLAHDEIFVFGSNLHGFHSGGAALTALKLFGAEMGNPVGLQGQSYAIPTMVGGIAGIECYVNDFLDFAENNRDKKFMVTRIGCGVAGFDDEDIAPLFSKALDMENVYLPQSFI